MVALQEALRGVRAGRALDVGTRLGEFAFRLAEAMPAGSEVTGIDNDPAAAEKAAYITPVPGGTGPVTRAVLMENTLAAALRHGKQ